MSEREPRKRIKVKGRYMQVRQRSTRNRKKGTIMGKWKSDRRGKKRVYRCKLPMHERLQRFCGYKKAGWYCLKGGDWRERCQVLVISYK